MMVLSENGWSYRCPGHTCASVLHEVERYSTAHSATPNVNRCATEQPFALSSLRIIQRASRERQPTSAESGNTTSATTNHVLRSGSLCKGLASLTLYPTADDIPFGSLNYLRKLPLPKEQFRRPRSLNRQGYPERPRQILFFCCSSHGKPHPLHPLKGALADCYAYCSKRKESCGSGEESNDQHGYGVQKLDGVQTMLVIADKRGTKYSP